CDYPTEVGNYKADCGTLVVPENRDDPASRLIALPVTRIHARSPNANAPVFRLEGGPGRSNMSFPDASRFADHHDVVLVGYRGVDGSSVLDCPEVVSALKHSDDMLSEKAMNAKFDAYKACASRLTAEGVDLTGYTLAQRVDDLEAARTALGYKSVDLLSESAGTRTSMIYTWRYPNSVHRSVMIGANPPGHFLWDARMTDRQIGNYSQLCAKDNTCRLGTDDLSASLRQQAAHVPDHWWFLPIKPGNVRLASFFGMMSSTSAGAPIDAPMTLDSWDAAAHGDASGLWFMSFATELTFPTAQVWGDVAAVSRSDVQAARNHFASDNHKGSILGDAGSTFLWANGRLADAWPSTAADHQYNKMQSSNVETLVISGALDFATPAQNATDEIMPFLPNGHQVVLQGFGHTDDFWNRQTDASKRLVNKFLDTGKVDDSLYKPQVIDFTPDMSQTSLAKIVAGALMLLALTTIVSLGLMARRVHTRDHFGRKASAVLRSVVPIVLGFGGWFLGILVVLPTLRSVPIDDVVLMTVSTAAPIGLAVYLAWVHRSWAKQTKLIGVAAAVLGALAGAFLGFHAAAGVVVIITTIAGAIAGANLALIGLDMTIATRVEPSRQTVVQPERELVSVG
ncbi:MAG TPA: alpha/beta hydrolase, partial [Ilumatobacteraceae bacterium]|nr:alpha/beta hydrolase [Ilumatobacteraceae bacterium]